MGVEKMQPFSMDVCPDRTFDKPDAVLEPEYFVKLRVPQVGVDEEDFLVEVRERGREVARDEVRRVANKYIHPIPHVVLVGDATKIKGQVSNVLKTAKIRVYDTKLQPK